MSKRALIDWCPLCGEKLPDDFVITRRMHDQMYHPLYPLLQSYGIEKCNHDDKTHYVIISIDEELPNYHVEFCDMCYQKISKSCIVDEKKLGVSFDE
jgi:hypothetical protein|tara:strand:+ start:254 stop:544 length:291 start_codon:yes stop_codon:yes gene_type:complete